MRRLTSCCCCGLSLDTGCRTIGAVDIVLHVVSVVSTFVKLGGFRLTMIFNAVAILADVCLISGSESENRGLIIIYIVFCWLVVLGLIALTALCFIYGLAA